jgi:ATP-dependent DNA helicase RecQ
VCAGRIARLPEPPALAPLAEQDFASVCGEFVGKHLEGRGHDPSVECLTRFLCGISVPLFTRLKARNIGGFAALEAYPYAQVREWIQRHVQ